MNLRRPVALLLWPLSLIYGAAGQLRRRFYDRGWLKQRRLQHPVISVGNLTVGGTGKTPMVIWLAEKFVAEGKRVGILSRGYRGEGGTSDEIEVMKRRLGGKVQFGIGSDRYGEGRKLESQGVDIFLLDDGFQHLQLARDLDIVLIDGTRELKREMILPAGCLREPISALERGDLIVYTRVAADWETSELVERLRGAREYPFFTSQTKLLGFRRDRSSDPLHSREQIGAGPFLAFCGVGNPQAFFADLKRWQLPIVGGEVFRDHHRYTAADCAELNVAASRLGAQGLITTEKDLQNIPAGADFVVPLFAGVIDLEIRSPRDFMTAIQNKIDAPHARVG